MKINLFHTVLLLLNGVYGILDTPMCNINVRKITDSLGSQNPNLGYRLTTSYQGNGIFHIQVQNARFLDTYDRILMYVRGKEATTREIHLGTLLAQNMGIKYKYLDGSYCNDEGVTAPTGSTIINGNDRPVNFGGGGGGKFTWKASASELAISDLKVYAVIAVREFGASPDSDPKWQVLDPVPLTTEVTINVGNLIAGQVVKKPPKLKANFIKPPMRFVDINSGLLVNEIIFKS
ncbi:hypothetical protein BC833DRAFT_598525 [Globomyces pollinis-pini]|nr:hypothetical protein BC833DRAFT_598525 [Globomyces pollinis-pini]